jgi:REP element-mobilizing transposase RayT
MRRNRIKVDGAAVYHCISRTVAGELMLDAEAKEVWRKLLWKVADFSGVEILTYCLMSNHFHVLVRIPEKTSERLSNDELLRRYTILYRHNTTPEHPDPRVMRLILEGGGEDAERWRRRLERRMSDVSEFIKTVKQRFSVWYNKRYRRFGTLWAERFKSVLVENSRFALQTVAAYIDLNPVRAEMVDDPGDYRWCGYAEALAGRKAALCGLCAVVDLPEDMRNAALAQYRVTLFGKGSVARREGDGVIDARTSEAIRAKQGELTSVDLSRHRMRYFSEGVLIGSEAFVRRMGEALGLERKTDRDSRNNEARELAKVPIESGSHSLMVWSRGRVHRREKTDAIESRPAKHE